MEFSPSENSDEILTKQRSNEGAEQQYILLLCKRIFRSFQQLGASATGPYSAMLSLIAIVVVS